MDIAELGMKIDSRPAAQSKTDLAALVKVAHEAERAFNGMAGAANKAAAAQTKMNTVNVQGVSAIGQLGKVGPSALDAINKRESAERKLISSMQDQIAVQAMLNTGHAREAAIFKAMRSAGAQANTQYGETVANLAGTLHDLQRKTEGTERSSRSLANTLTRRFIGAVLLTQVRAATEAVINLSTELSKTGQVGELIGFGSQRIQGLQSVAGFKGVDTGKFLDDMVKFNQQIPLAQKGIGSLGELLRANGVVINNTADAFDKVADLVMNAADNTARLSILQQAGLPATLQMMNLMKQGADEIKRQGDLTNKLTDQQIADQRRVEKEWNRMWVNFALRGKAAVVEIFDPSGWAKAGNDLIALLRRAGGERSGVIIQPTPERTPILTGEFSGVAGAKPTVDWATVRAEREKAISFEQRWLGLLGQTTTATEARRQVELQLNSAALDHVGVDGKRAETIKRLAYETSLGVTAMKASTDALRVEAATINMSAGQAAAYTALKTSLNEAERNGVIRKPEEIELLRQQAIALGGVVDQAARLRIHHEISRERQGLFLTEEDVRIAERLKAIYPDIATALNSAEASAMRFNMGMKSIMDSTSNLTSTALIDFRNELSNGASAWEAFRSAGARALTSISDQLIRIATSKMISSLFGNLMGGIPMGAPGFGSGGGLFGMPTNLHTGGIVGVHGKLIHRADAIAELQALKLPNPELLRPLVIAVQLTGGLMVLLGVQAHLGALLLLGFTALATLIAHRPFDHEGPARRMQFTIALEHLAICGGLLLLACFGPGRFSIDWAMR